MLLIVIFTIGFVYWKSRPTLQERVQSAQDFMEGIQWEQAREVAEAILLENPQAIEARVIAGQAATQLGLHDTALQHFSQLPNASKPHELNGLYGAGAPSNELRRLAAAERSLREALRREPDHVFSHDRLAFVLSVSGRGWESTRHLIQLVKARRFTLWHLIWLGDVERPVATQNDLLPMHRANPDDPLPLLGIARDLIRQENPQEALTVLRQALALEEDLLSAHVFLGQLFLQNEKGFISWHKQLPSRADDHPETWVIRGQWALGCNEREAAARCFWEALRREPNHRSACYQLGHCLLGLERDEEATVFLQRAEALQQLSRVTQDIAQVAQGKLSSEGLELPRQAAELSESLGRFWEANAWAGLGMSQGGEHWAEPLLRRVQPRLHAQLGQTDPDVDPTQALDLIAYKIPSGLFRREQLAQSPRQSNPDRQIRFTDVANSTGIDFQFFNSPDLTTAGARMFEITGGGVAILDFDGDHWPDIYFCQGCSWPPKVEASEKKDQLFRNASGQRHIDVTRSANLNEDQFSQGAAVGDFNNDGFPDLYVANIGDNRLYRNNGDGTFSDISRRAGIQGNKWTLSCLLADLNGDGYADLYDVNYLEGEDVFSKICRRPQGAAACHPSLFPSAADQFYLSDGAGGFQPMSQLVGLDAEQGSGMGVIAADFFNRGKLDLFVSNDSVDNHFYSNRTEDSHALPNFQEQAKLTGLAVDQSGTAQACMGIAAGDVNADGRIDLFVTNLYNESNTLYLQEEGQLFRDATRQYQLREASFHRLGWGTQFLDVDLDGWTDLMTANGHLDDHRFQGEPYHMQPQLFHNTGKATFEEVPNSLLGGYFERKVLGRGLTLTDWNRDGRPDVVVSHLDSPAALLSNETENVGHFLIVHLRGVRSARDAFGVMVTLVSDGRTWTQQLIAGNGYLSSNYRVIRFGLGDQAAIDQVQIQWPSGETQLLEGPSIDSEVVIVEGGEVAVRLKH